MMIPTEAAKKHKEKNLRKKALQHWTEGWKAVNTDCSFDTRLGMVPGEKRSPVPPALLLETRQGAKRLEIRPNDSLPSGLRMCEYDVDNKDTRVRYAHIMTVPDSATMFRNWPYINNRVQAAKMSGARAMLLLGKQDCHNNIPYANAYLKVLAARIALDHPLIDGVYYLDWNAFYTFSGNDKFLNIHKEKRFDLEFVKATTKSSAFWLVRTDRFYARDAPLSRAILDRWLGHRCDKDDKWSLFDTILNFAASADCLKYANELDKFTSDIVQSEAWKQVPHLNLPRADLKCRQNKFRLTALTIPPQYAQSFSANPVQRAVQDSDTLHFAYYNNRSLFRLKVTNLLANMTPPVQFTGGMASPHRNLLRVLGLWQKGEMITDVDY